MNLSLRLKSICNMVDKCNCIGDIGTDHAYIPVYLVKNNVCKTAIASDINIGPIKKAADNIRFYGLQDKIDCRLGSGLNTIKVGEVDEIIIAGMGGNLIRDIIDSDIEVFKNSKYFILQPVQNSEILRKYIYNIGFDIVDEDLCIDENVFYEIIKIRYNNFIRKTDDIFYEVGKKLIEKNHPLIKLFIYNKIHKYDKIISYIKENTVLAKKRKYDLEEKIIKLQELIKCL